MSQNFTKRDMRFPTDTSFIIIGTTSDGRRFRPSDWAERLCGVLSAFGTGKKMTYSPYVSPGLSDGEKAVFVDGQLYDAEPMAYRFVLNFAQDNDLKLIAATCPISAQTA